MNQELVLVVIGIVVAALVLRPLLRGRSEPPSRPIVAQATRPSVSADELAELELDHSMGRVSDADYAIWRGQLEADVISAPDVIAPAKTDAAVKAEALVRKFRDLPRLRCPTCGVRPEPAARFCSNCGKDLQA